MITDGLGRERESRVPAFVGGVSVVRTAYDRLGRVATQSRPFITGVVDNTSYQFDNRDRLVRMTEPGIIPATVRHEYHGLAAHTYDARGSHSFVVERPDGQIDSRHEDDPDSTDPDAWLRTRFEYGPFGTVSRVVAADGTSQTMIYDKRGRRTEHVDPSAGTTTTSYNAFGDVIEEENGAGHPVHYDYDILGRPTRITSPDGTATNTWDVSPFGKGRLYEGKSADGIVTRHHYDDAGHHIRSTWDIEQSQYRIDFGYDSIGRLGSITYPTLPGVSNRFKVDYVYKTNGDLWQAKDSPSGALYWQADVRNAAGQLEQETHGNNVVGTRQYEAATGLLSSIATAGPAGQLDRLTYLYDENRNVIRRDSPGDATTQAFTYDALNRLIQWNYAKAPLESFITTFAYNDIGNLLTETTVGRTGRNAVYTYGQGGAPPHALTQRNSTRYTYDAAGRQVTGPDRTLAYNRQDLPTLLTRGNGQTTSFEYDATGARVLKRDTAETTISIAGLFERRITSEARNVHFVIADDRAVAQITRIQAVANGPITGTEVRYLHPDGQGSTIQATASNGTVAERFFYDPFGRRTDANYDYIGNQRRAIRLGYTGHDHDDELGLINMKGRIYDPEARRFLTPDPLVPDPFFSQSYNRYSYVWNNPMTFVDPSGFERKREDPPRPPPPHDPWWGFGSLLDWTNGMGTPTPDDSWTNGTGAPIADDKGGANRGNASGNDSREPFTPWDGSTGGAHPYAMGSGSRGPSYGGGSGYPACPECIEIQASTPLETWQVSMIRAGIALPFVILSLPALVGGAGAGALGGGVATVGEFAFAGVGGGGASLTIGSIGSVAIAGAAAAAAATTLLATPTDRIKEHLTERDLDAARRESKGEVVSRKPDGTPYNHLQEVREAQQGLLNRIERIRNRLGYPNLADAERAALERELSEASRLLDHAKGFLGL
jgi:RHS repeat-associated protein